jgi:hypothetical protein
MGRPVTEYGVRILVGVVVLSVATYRIEGSFTPRQTARRPRLPRVFSQPENHDTPL